jgi:hypothetical protein
LYILVIPAIQEAEARESSRPFQSDLMRPYLKTKYNQKDWVCGSSGRMLAKHLQSPRFNSQCREREREEREREREKIEEKERGREGKEREGNSERRKKGRKEGRKEG